ncbi:hypothetical protein ON010_g16711 [Phytophthora cinnamomi]|nr:hypothetical protein ON010_g16711 [Phytophthora cinnamomi]
MTSQQVRQLKATPLTTTNVSLNVGYGEVVFAGRNGAGRTTLLKILNRVSKPDAGSVTYFPDAHGGALMQRPRRRLEALGMGTKTHSAAGIDKGNESPPEPLLTGRGASNAALNSGMLRRRCT